MSAHGGTWRRGGAYSVAGGGDVRMERVWRYSWGGGGGGGGGGDK